MGMDQYLLIQFLMGCTSIYQLFWGSLGTRVLTHPHTIPHSPIVCLQNSPIASGKVTLERDKQTPSWGLLWVRHGRSSGVALHQPVAKGYQSNATYHGSDLGLS